MGRLLVCGFLFSVASYAAAEGDNQTANPDSSGAPASLLEALRDKDPGVRLQAAQLLVEMGEAKVALPAVEELLKVPEEAIRLEAGLLLKQMGPARLAAQLRDRDPSVRLKAAQGLWQMGGTQARESIPVLLELLKNPQEEIRLGAALTLTQRGVSEAKAAIPVLVEGLKDAQARNRLQAAQRLQQIGAAEISVAAPVLVELLRDHYGEFSSQPAMVLGQMRPTDLRAVAAALLETLKSPTPAVRLQAALVVMRIGPAQTQAAIPVLIDLLAESDSNLRLQASQGLGRIGPEAKAAIGSLVKLLDDPPTARVAALALRQLGPDALQAVLEKLTAEREAQSAPRSALRAPLSPGVIQAIAQFGPAAGAAAPKLVETLGSQNGTVRELAARALEQIGKMAVAPLSQALSEKDPRLRQTVAGILGRIGAAAGDAIPALTRALADSDAQVRIESALALWEVDHPAEKVIPGLLEGLRGRNPVVRRRCATVLAQIEPMAPHAVSALEAALKNSDKAVQVNAAESLCHVRGQSKKAIPVLTAALTDRSLRSQAVDALGRTGADAGDAVPALLAALQDETKEYAFAARVGWAIRQITGPESTPILLRGFEASLKRFRPLVVQALAQTGPAGFAALVKLADHDDPAVRLVVVRSLAGADWSVDDRLPALKKALGDKDREVRREAIRAMGSMGTAARTAVPALNALLREAGEDRILAAQALASVEPGNERVISLLASIIEGDDFAFRRQAIAALGRIGPPAKAAVPALEHALDSTDVLLQLEAALALANVGVVETLNAEREAQSARRPALTAPLLERVFAVLLAVVRERNHPFRMRAMEALSRVGVKKETAVAVLTRALWDEGPAQIKAAEVLGRIGPPARPAVPSLTPLLLGPDPEARIQAALALWRIDRQTKETVPVLMVELKDNRGRRQPSPLPAMTRFGAVPNSPALPPCEQAAEALGEIGPAARAAVSALTGALEEPRLAASRPYFAVALLKIEPRAADAALTVLVDVLDEKSQPPAFPERSAAPLRREIAGVLGQVGNEKIDANAIRVLGKALEDADKGVRREAIKALGAIGIQRNEVAAALRKALADPDETVRSEAAAALKRVGG